MNKLKSKTVLITGGSQGLGAEIAMKVVSKGARVVLLARRKEWLKKTEVKIKTKKGQVLALECDIRKGDEVEKAVKEVISVWGGIDVLVNNAGVWTDDSIEVDKPEMRRKAVETNILGQINITESVLPYMKKKSKGIIFNVISTAAVSDIPSGNNVLWKSYGASKWGFTGYTHALRESLRETKIKVIQFFPGGFESNLYENAGRKNPHNQPWMMKTGDVADIVLFALTRPDDVYMEKIVMSKMM